MSDLARSTAAGTSGGSSASGVAAGVAAPSPGSGTSAPALAAGTVATGAPATASAPEPNGGVSLLGRLVSGAALEAHDHEDAAGGGVIDYTRLVVSATAPPAPAAPSDAFWLNPGEEA